MSISYWLDESESKKKHSYDIVIIGGGIAGLSTAYWLLKEDPSLKLALIEKNRLGYGATGRNAGFITCGSVEHFNRLIEKHGNKQAAEIWRFSEENLNLLEQEIIREDSQNILFEKSGSFSLASTESEFRELRNSSDLMQKLGIDTEILQQTDVERRLGAIRFVGGIKYMGDASVHPLKLLELLKRRIDKNQGQLKIFESCEAYRFSTAKNDSKIVHTDRFKLQAQIVILATNAYSYLLHPYFKDKIYPTKGQVLITKPIHRFMEGPCYANFVLDYFRQLPTGEMIIGGFRQLEKETEIGFSDHTTPAIQSALEKFLNDHIPKIKGSEITHRWSGIMGFSSDGQPMVGSIPSDPKIFFTGGFTAHGLGLAFNCGKKLVDALFDRPIPQFLSAKRF